jgi:hypothetical protein
MRLLLPLERNVGTLSERGNITARDEGTGGTSRGFFLWLQYICWQEGVTF